MSGKARKGLAALVSLALGAASVRGWAGGFQLQGGARSGTGFSLPRVGLGGASIELVPAANLLGDFARPSSDPSASDASLFLKALDGAARQVVDEGPEAIWRELDIHQSLPDLGKDPQALREWTAALGARMAALQALAEPQSFEALQALIAAERSRLGDPHAHQQALLDLEESLQRAPKLGEIRAFLRRLEVHLEGLDFDNRRRGLGGVDARDAPGTPVLARAPAPHRPGESGLAPLPETAESVPGTNAPPPPPRAPSPNPSRRGPLSQAWGAALTLAASALALAAAGLAGGPGIWISLALITTASLAFGLLSRGQPRDRRSPILPWALGLSLLHGWFWGASPYLAKSVPEIRADISSARDAQVARPGDLRSRSASASGEKGRDAFPNRRAATGVEPTEPPWEREGVDAALRRVERDAFNPRAGRVELRPEHLRELRRIMNTWHYAQPPSQIVELIDLYLDRLLLAPPTDEDIAALTSIRIWTPSQLAKLANLVKRQLPLARKAIADANQAARPVSAQTAAAHDSLARLAALVGRWRDAAHLRELADLSTKDGAVYRLLPRRAGAPLRQLGIATYNAEHFRLQDLKRGDELADKEVLVWRAEAALEAAAGTNKEDEARSRLDRAKAALETARANALENADAPPKKEGDENLLQRLERLGRVIDVLRSLGDSDVIALQEAGPIDHLRALLASVGLLKRYPNLVYFPSNETGQGLLILATARVRIEPESLGGYQHGARPAWGRATLDLGAGRRLRVINVHPKAAPLPGSKNYDEKAAQAKAQRDEELTELRRELDADPDLPTILLGDFNTDEAHRSLEGLAEVEAEGPTHIGGRIDRVLHGPGIEVVGSHVIGGPPLHPSDPARASDHLPRALIVRLDDTR